MSRSGWALILLPALVAVACGGDGAQQEILPFCAAEPGPAPLRLMTRFECGRTISDLTGVPASVAAELPPDEETLGFDDIATAYSVASLHAARKAALAPRPNTPCSRNADSKV